MGSRDFAFHFEELLCHQFDRLHFIQTFNKKAGVCGRKYDHSHSKPWQSLFANSDKRYSA